MSDVPETRVSLILRLAEPANIQAWQEFADIYTPALLAMARRKGLQSADAEDVTQEILFGVARSVQRFQPDASRARFRTWLWRIARNLLADHAAGRRRRPEDAYGSDSWLEAVCQPNMARHDEDDPELQGEVKASMFRLAARRAQLRVLPATWQAFQLSALENRPAKAISEQLKISQGNVYVARSRVMKMIRTEVQRMQSCEQDSAAAEQTGHEEQR